jgi:hypothetical protein
MSRTDIDPKAYKGEMSLGESLRTFSFLIPIVFTFLFSFNSSAQLVDSIRTSLTKKTKLDARLDTRNTFITNQKSQVFGIKLGVTFGNRLKLGGGLNSLKDYRAERIIHPATIDAFGVDTVSSVLKLDYLCYYMEYVFYKTRKWEISIPVQIGFGNTRHEFYHKNKLHVINKKHLLIYEPTMSCKYKFFPWIGVGAEVGYRVVFGNTRVTRRDFKFAAPTYGLNLLIYYGELFRMVFPKKQKVAQ